MRPHEDGERVVSAYHDTRSLRAAGALLECSATTVGRRLAALGVERGPARRKRRPSFPADHVGPIVARYQDRAHPASLMELARDFESSPGKVRRLLEFEGVPIRPRGRRPRSAPPAAPARAVVRLHRQGLRPADIAARLECDRRSVLRVLRAEGLTPNRGKRLPPVSQLRAHGWSVHALARHYGISEKRIREALEGTDEACSPPRGRRGGPPGANGGNVAPRPGIRGGRAA
jgi:uncharacterized protein (DUF433 family)